MKTNVIPAKAGIKPSRWIPACAGMTLIFLLAGCGPKAETPAVTSDVAQETPAAAAKTPDLSQAGSVAGHVHFEGTPPEVRDVSVKGNPECSVMHEGGIVKQEEFLAKDGNLQNVFVYVKSGLEAYAFAAPTTPVEIDNLKCTYVPHVTGVQVGQPVLLLNSDATLHNIHAYAKINKSWNLGLPFQNMKQTKTFSEPEVMVKLKCDVHPWMAGYVGVLPHPYFAVTGRDGAFALPNLPPGTYVIEAWHEKLGAQSQTVTIGPRESKTADFVFKA